jgi:hypothetical protein
VATLSTCIQPPGAIRTCSCHTVPRVVRPGGILVIRTPDPGATASSTSERNSKTSPGGRWTVTARSKSKALPSLAVRGWGSGVSLDVLIAGSWEAAKATGSARNACSRSMYGSVWVNSAPCPRARDNVEGRGGVDGADLVGLAGESAVVFRLQHQHRPLPVEVSRHGPVVAGKVADRSHHADQVSLRQLVVEDVMKQGHPELLVRADVGK